MATSPTVPRWRMRSAIAVALLAGCATRGGQRPPRLPSEGASLKGIAALTQALEAEPTPYEEEWQRFRLALTDYRAQPAYREPQTPEQEQIRQLVDGTAAWKREDAEAAMKRGVYSRVLRNVQEHEDAYATQLLCSQEEGALTAATASEIEQTVRRCAKTTTPPAADGLGPTVAALTMVLSFVLAIDAGARVLAVRRGQDFVRYPAAAGILQLVAMGLAFSALNENGEKAKWLTVGAIGTMAVGAGLLTGAGVLATTNTLNIHTRKAIRGMFIESPNRWRNRGLLGAIAIGALGAVLYGSLGLASLPPEQRVIIAIQRMALQHIVEERRRTSSP